jgi:hypothetical protein
MDINTGMDMGMKTTIVEVHSWIARRIYKPLTVKIVRFFKPLICEKAEMVNVLKAITSSIWQNKKFTLL